MIEIIETPVASRALDRLNETRDLTRAQIKELRRLLES